MTVDLALSGETSEFEDFHLLNGMGHKRLLARYEDNAVEETLDLKWNLFPFNRVALMTLLAARIGAQCRYLEIGCAKNDLFFSLPLRGKVGVDPVEGGNRRMTSDAFFEQNEDTFDLIFLDGLHTYEQLHRDVENALKVLRPGGFIGIHDLVPRNWKEAHVPRLQGIWTGDVWKVGVELARSEAIDFRIVLIDHGVGLIHRSGEAPPVLADLRAELGDAGFAEFHALFDTLPTRSWQETEAMIAKVTR